MIEQQESFIGSPHSMILGLNSTKDTDHTVLFLGFVERDGEVFIRLADGMMTTFVNPSTWGLLWYRKDSKTGTYLYRSTRSGKISGMFGWYPPQEPSNRSNLLK